MALPASALLCSLGGRSVSIAPASRLRQPERPDCTFGAQTPGFSQGENAFHFFCAL